MNKRISIIMIALCLSLNLYAKSSEKENLISVDGFYLMSDQSITEGSREGHIKTKGAGLDLTFYSIKPDAKIGFYGSISYGVPLEYQKGSNTVDLKEYSFKIMTDIILGPAFKIIEKSHFKLLGGIGPHIYANIGLESSTADSVDSMADYSIGIGAGLSAIYMVSETFYLNGGAKLAYDFWYPITSYDIDKYSNFTIVPKAGIGFKY